MPPVSVAQRRVHFHAVENDQAAQAVGEVDIQPADGQKPIFVRPVSDTDIRRDWQLGFALQVLTRRQVKGRSIRRADAVRAGPEYERRTLVGLRHRQPINERVYSRLYLPSWSW